MTNDFAPSNSKHSPEIEERLAVDGLQLFLAHWRGALAGLGVIVVSVALIGVDLRPEAQWAAWFLATGGNTGWQAYICWRMQRLSPHAAYVDWHRWLLTSIGLNGLLFGSLPLSALDMPNSALAIPVGLVFMLLFCIASSPGTLGMSLTGCWSVILSVSALLVFGHRWLVGGVFLGFAILLGFYGYRLQLVWRQGMLHQYAAERLAAELQNQQAKVTELERERTLLMERQRLSRDMHDGIGSALISSLSAVQRGDWSQDKVAEMLRDCLDDLRAVIYSLEPSDGDLTAMLAAMRPRLERRLEASRMRLCWEMGDLPTVEWLGPSEGLHVMRIVQESVANAIKHSEASEVCLIADSDGATINISIIDNGRGFELERAPKSNGIESVRSRSAILGGILQVQSSNDGTRVTLKLPARQRA